MNQNKKKSLGKKLRRDWMLYLFMLPGLLWLLIFHYWPLYGVVIAFQDFKIGDVMGASKWVGLKHFIQFFNSYWFPTLMKNTITIGVMTFVLGFPIPIILALLMNELTNMKFKKTIQTITYAPHFISVVVLCGALQLFLTPSTGLIGGTLNSIRSMLGMEEINLLMDAGAFKWVYVLSGIWQTSGWGAVIYFAALSAVDPQQIEAAKIEGATKLQRMRYINLPVLLPTIVIQLILKCGSVFSVGYEKVYLLQNDSILSASEVISTYVYRTGLGEARFSAGTAIGLFNNVINASILILANWIVRKVDDDLSLF